MKLIDPDELERVLRPILTDESCPLHIAAEIDMNLDLMPKVDAVLVRHGKWVDDSNGIEGAWNYCSVCGEQAIDLYDYCPNCGAKMDEEDGDHHEGI